MARTSDSQDFNRGPSVVRGTTYMAAMHGPGDHLWQPNSVRGTDYGETIPIYGMIMYQSINQSIYGMTVH